ncbi:glutamine--fructose-6-phosphate transaminase (isomerizing), partial [Patescibacteria group bacterium]|nr:glutamine--fructose-6-phosphate transaminase (isomerizing) [Patescibacteria group bacterium]
HLGKSGRIAIAHNGIIENYRELKEKHLKGYKLNSQTDTEILAHLIDKFSKKEKNLQKAVESALKLVEGTYGLVVISLDEPAKIIAARCGSPLAIGVGKDEHFIASDASPILPYTRKIIYLDDGEMAVVTGENCELFRIGEGEISKEIQHIEWNTEEAQKGGYANFMLKEIYDQPEVYMDAIRGRIREKEGSAHMGGFNMSDEQARKIERVVMLACGTASYAGMVGKYLFEKMAQLPTDCEVGSEYRYRNPIVDKKTLIFAISQSGETLDTLASLREAKRKGGHVRGIINVIGSTIARESDGGTYIHAGPELAVASTKAFTNMLAILTLYALYFGRLHKMSFETGQKIVQELKEIPKKMNEVLGQAENLKRLAKKYKKYKNMLFLGRGLNFPVALEGSHKLKEISYIHSEAYPAGEMKHGVNALLEKDFPVLGIATRNSLYEKMISNLEEVRARKSPLIVLATKGDDKARELSHDVIYVPQTMEILEPLINTIPLQLFAYYLAVELKRDVDRPRNLAKSVTVE